MNINSRKKLIDNINMIRNRKDERLLKKNEKKSSYFKDLENKENINSSFNANSERRKVVVTEKKFILCNESRSSNSSESLSNPDLDLEDFIGKTPKNYIPLDESKITEAYKQERSDYICGNCFNSENSNHSFINCPVNNNIQYNLLQSVATTIHDYIYSSSSSSSSDSISISTNSFKSDDDSIPEMTESDERLVSETKSKDTDGSFYSSADLSISSTSLSVSLSSLKISYNENNVSHETLLPKEEIEFEAKKLNNILQGTYKSIDLIPFQTLDSCIYIADHQTTLTINNPPPNFQISCPKCAEKHTKEQCSVVIKAFPPDELILVNPDTISSYVNVNTGLI